MKNIIAYLMKVLNDESRHLTKTNELLKRKEQVLIKNDMKQLEEIVLKERELFLGLRDLEESRKSIVELFTTRYGLKEKVVNLSRVAEILGGRESHELEKMKDRINEQIKTINRQNEKCAFLLRKSIELTDFSIKLLSGSISKQKTYSRNGIVGNEVSRNKIILDYKA